MAVEKTPEKREELKSTESERCVVPILGAQHEPVVIIVRKEG